MQGIPPQVVGHEVVQRLFRCAGDEFLGDGDAVGVADVFQHLPSQGPMADGGEASLELVELPITAQAGILCPEAFSVAEGLIVDEANQAVQLHQRVLQWGGGQQHLGRVRQRPLESSADLVVGAVDVAQPVGFIDDHQIPLRHHQIRALSGRELKRANHQSGLFERIADTALPLTVVFGTFENLTGQEKLVGHLLRPLLAQIGRADDQDAPLALDPLLSQHQAGFDGLSKPYFVGEDGALGQGRLKREQRGLHLMGVQVHLRIEQGTGQLFGIPDRMPAAEFMGVKLGVIIGAQFPPNEIAFIR